MSAAESFGHADRVMLLAFLEKAQIVLFTLLHQIAERPAHPIAGMQGGGAHPAG